MSDIDGSIVGETDKAFLIKFEKIEEWIPKSAMKNRSIAQKNISQKFTTDNSGCHKTDTSKTPSIKTTTFLAFLVSLTISEICVKEVIQGHVDDHVYYSTIVTSQVIEINATIQDHERTSTPTDLSSR